MALELAERQARERAESAPGLRPIDALIVGYVAIVSVLALVRGAAVVHPGYVFLAHGLVVALILLVTRRDLGRVGSTLRDLYPLFLLLAFYGEIDLLNGAGARVVHDTLIQGWEAALFGGQPSRDWWRSAPSALWSTVFHGAYLSYYAIVITPALAFAARRDGPALRHSVLTVMATFFACYLFFLLFPVAGPYYAFPHPSGTFIDNGPARIVYRTLSQGSAYGAAFPSSHVAGAVAATVSAWIAWRRLGYVLAVPTALLTVGVVYCQMHYAVDAIGGLMVGILGALLVQRFGGVRRALA